MANARWTAGPDDAGIRLDKYLAAAERLGSRTRAAAAIARGKVFLNDREVSRDDAATRLTMGDMVRVWTDRPGTSRALRRTIALGGDRDLPLIYEDDAIVVLNKPAGVLAVPLAVRGEARSVFDDLKRYLKARRRPRPFVVHRIDRDTSGLVLFAKTAAARERLKDQFKRHKPERVYLAVVYGHPSPASGVWRDRLIWDEGAMIQKETHPGDPRGKEAICRYRVLEELRGASLLEISLVTGRRNQIRLQARLRGHTLVGERRYVYGPEHLRPIAFERQALHARRLTFSHPIDGRSMSFEAPLPEDMEKLIARIRRKASS